MQIVAKIYLKILRVLLVHAYLRVSVVAPTSDRGGRGLGTQIKKGSESLKIGFFARPLEDIGAFEFLDSSSNDV